MSFFQLVRREMYSSLPKLVFMSGLAGLSTAAILAAINAGVQAVEGGKKASLWAVSLFVVSLFLFIKTQRYVTIATTAEIESIIHKLRVRLLDQIRRSELLAIERIGRSRIVATISSDTAVLTQASNILCFSVQGIVLVFFVAIYVADLSLAPFAMSAVIVVAAAIIFHMKNRSVSAQAREAAEREGQLFGRLIDFLDGFKEVRLNNTRSADLFDDAFEVSRSAAEIKIRSRSEILRQIVFTHGALFILLGVVVFVAPNFTDSSGGASITKTTTALLFVVGACFGLVQSIPGKSTFLKVLAGLYPPDSGELTLDGARIEDDTLDTYRALISAVFTDYHLFPRLYRVPEPDPAEFDRLLTVFRLTAKTAHVGREFSSLDLSGGQRKRLALIVSLLEKRPILLLDEWTSDQDPEFRRKFYLDLLPELMRAGVTVIAITHDDRYLDELDLPMRRLRMDEGRFVEQRSMQTA
jgi:ABC-type siderophore export system fused ATPase/permease subunit